MTNEQPDGLADVSIKTKWSIWSWRINTYMLVVAGLIVLLSPLIFYISLFAADSGNPDIITAILYCLVLFVILTAVASILSWWARRNNKPLLSFILVASVPILSVLGGITGTYIMITTMKNTPVYDVNMPRFVCNDGTFLAIYTYPASENILPEISQYSISNNHVVAGQYLASVIENPKEFVAGSSLYTPDPYENVQAQLDSCKDSTGETLYDYYHALQPVLPFYATASTTPVTLSSGVPFSLIRNQEALQANGIPLFWLTNLTIEGTTTATIRIFPYACDVGQLRLCENFSQNLTLKVGGSIIPPNYPSNLRILLKDVHDSSAEFVVTDGN